MTSTYLETSIAKHKEIDEFLILEEIGSGGSGTVFKARKKNTGQIVAIKVLKLHDTTDAKKIKQRIARFDRETELCARINHPNIVRLIDKGYCEKQEPYAVFEHIEGQTLKQYIKSTNGCSIVEINEIMIQLLDGLHCAHSHGIIHRDLKPHNIMISHTATRPHVKILDFGIGAFAKEFRSDDYKTLTLTQEIMGTPSYSSPEQLRGEVSSEKSDIYTWGLILLECLTGTPVFKGRSLAEVFQQQLMPLEIPLPSFILGHSLGHLLRRVLKKNPQQRIANTKLLLEELEKVNFNTIHPPSKKDNINEDEVTRVSNNSSSNNIRRKQLTVLCAKLDLYLSKKVNIDPEIIDAIRKDQLNLLKDITTKFGGHTAGELSNHLMVYFGYPETQDTDVRRAGQAALELKSEMEKRNTLLKQTYDLEISLRVTLNTGTFLVFPNQQPEGHISHTAFEWLYQTSPNTIKVGSLTKKMLDPFMDLRDQEIVSLLMENEQEITYSLLAEKSASSEFSLRSQSVQRPLIGREKEKDLLLTTWQQIRNNGQCILIHGQAGIGKSRLTYELKQQLTTQQHVIIESWCLPERQNSALYPIFNLLEKHWGLKELEEDTKKIDRISQLLSVLPIKEKGALALICSWLSIPYEGDLSIALKTPQEQKEKLFNILRECIYSLSENASILLVIEDIHWIDPTSEEFLVSFNEVIKNHPILLIFTSRPLKKWFISKEFLKQIHLLPLATSNGIVDSILHEVPVDSVIHQYIAERTDGIPLYIEELTNMLLDQEYLQITDDKYQLIPDFEKQFVPTTLQDLLNARLDRTGASKETIQLAATIGRSFEDELLVNSSTRDAFLVQQDLELLINANLILRQEENYLFRHALIRDAAYEEITYSNRKNLHGRIAKTIEKQCTVEKENNLQIIAFHFEQAKDFEKSQKYWFNSALVSYQQTGVYQDTIFYLSKALKYVESIQDSNEKIESKIRIHNLLGETQLYTSGFTSSEVEDNNEKAFQLAYENDINPELKFKVLNSKCFNQINRGDIDGARKIVEKLSNVSHKNVSVSNFINAQTNDCYVKYLRAEFTEVVEICKSIYELNRETKKEKGEVIEFNSLAVIKCFEFISNVYLGNIQLAEKQISEVLKESIDLGYDDMLAGTHWQIASAYLIKASYFEDADEDLDKVNEHLIKAIDIATKNKLGFIVTGCKLMKECLALLQGTVESEASFLQLFNQSGLIAFKEWYYLFLIKFLYDKKEYSKALVYVNEGLDACTLNGINYPVLYYHCFKGMILFELGEEDCENSFLKSIELSKKNSIKWGELFCVYQYVNRFLTGKMEQNEKTRLIEELITSFPNRNTDVITKSVNWRKIMNTRKLINH